MLQYARPWTVGDAAFIGSRMETWLAGWLAATLPSLGIQCRSGCTNRLRRPPSLPSLPASGLLLLVSARLLPRILSLIHCHQTPTPHARRLSSKTFPIIVPQPRQRSLRRAPQIRQIRHIAVSSLMPDIDEESRQADFLRLGVHGDFVFGFLLGVEEAGHEAVPVSLLVDDSRGGGEERTEISP